MRQQVVVVESAYIAKSLHRILKSTGILGDALCLATLGRLLDATSETVPLEIKSSRKPVHKEVVNRFHQVKNADVYIATDGDIEGELIAYDAISLMKGKNNHFYRLEFTELTEEGVERSLGEFRPINHSHIESCLARRGFDFALKQQAAPVGRVQARLMADVQEGSLPNNYEALLAEVSLTGKNTVSVLVEMALQGHRPLEVTHSLQKIYSQGRITYPRTLAGLSKERNSLVATESHDQIQVTKNGFLKMHYDTDIDEAILDFINKPVGDCLTSRLPKPPSDKRDIFSLLHAYRYPYLRASTLGSHTHWLSRAMKKDAKSLTNRSWSVYHNTVMSHPALVRKKQSELINKLLYLGDGGHQTRIKMALESLGDPSEGSGRAPLVFEYPDEVIVGVDDAPVFE